MKLYIVNLSRDFDGQPPSGGCVLKHLWRRASSGRPTQPPSGGCVLKRSQTPIPTESLAPAAFRRLCVETRNINGPPLRLNSQPPSGGCVLKPCRYAIHSRSRQPAAFRRLCVETLLRLPQSIGRLPAAFRRLCVETKFDKGSCLKNLPAAFRRLCVETKRLVATPARKCQPPSGGCVLKQFRKAKRIIPTRTSRLQAAVC